MRDFYSRIPPKYWAAIDGRPVVWLYDTLWAAAFDQSSIDYLSERFAQDFGGTRLFVVRESQWEVAKHSPPQAQAASWTASTAGAPAPSGFNADPKLTIAQVGPGFKNTQYCTGGPASNCFDVDREGGARYEAAAPAGRRERASDPGGRDLERVQRGHRHRRDGRDRPAVHRADPQVRRPAQAGAAGVSWLDERAGEAVCYLTTRGRRTGRPHEIEIWFGVADGRLYMLSGGHRPGRLGAQHQGDAGRDGPDRRRDAPGRGRIVDDPAEDAVARRLLADKYDQREADGSPDEWARTALPVAVDFDE